MSLTGIVDFGAEVLTPLPVGEFSLIALDGSHHAIADIGGVCKVGCAETQTAHYSRTEAQWRTDLAGLSMGTSGTYTLEAMNGATGTPYFFILGYQYSTHGSFVHDTVGVRYKIAASGSVSVDGGFFYRTSVDGLVQGSFYGGPVGQSLTIDGVCYCVMRLGNRMIFASVLHEYYLVKLPLSGTQVDTADNSWDAFHTQISGTDKPFTAGQFEAGSGRHYYSRAAVMPGASGQIGVLLFNSAAESGGAQALYASVNPVAQTASDAFDLTDSFVPLLTDSQKKYDGTASADPLDNYTAPSVTSAGELIWLRGFSDNQQYVGYVRTTMDASLNVTHVDSARFQLTVEAVSTGVLAAFMYRDGGDLLTMMVDANRFIFGYTTVVAPTPPPPAEYFVVPVLIGCPYTSRAQLLRPDFGNDAGAQAGPAFAKKRRIHWYGAYLYRTRSITFGTDFDASQKPARLSTVDGGTEIGNTELLTGIISAPIVDDYSWTGQIAWEQTRPTPGTILAVSGYISTQDK